MKKFNDFCCVPNRKQKVKIDSVADGLKKYFLDPTEQKINLPKVTEDDQDKMVSVLWNVSFIKIINLWPDIEQIHFFNWYRFDDNILEKLIEIIKMKDVKLKHVKFLYYDYEDPLDEYPFFFDPEKLNKGLLQKLEGECKWKISYSESCNGYRINLRAQ